MEQAKMAQAKMAQAKNLQKKLSQYLVVDDFCNTFWYAASSEQEAINLFLNDQGYLDKNGNLESGFYSLKLYVHKVNSTNEYEITKPLNVGAKITKLAK